MAERPPVLLSVRDLKKYYQAGGFFGRSAPPVRAVDGVSFNVNRAETLALVGESGCGKSSVGRTILRLQEPTSGQASFEGVEIFSLDRAALRHLAERMLPGYDPISLDRVVRRVATDSAGLPLFAVELLRAVRVVADGEAHPLEGPVPARLGGAPCRAGAAGPAGGATS